jgi:hypothetical protein
MKTERIHFGYIVTFLIIAIICLVTIKWGAIKDLTNYIIFALTLTSLVLAVLAIVYSFFSNASMTQNISNLEEASKKISTNSELLNSAALKLQQNIGDMPTTLKNIESKTDTTLKVFEEFSQKELFVRKLTQTKEVDENEKSIGKLISYNSSISGIGMLFALKLACENNVIFDIEDFSLKTDLSDKSYLLGFLVACSSIKLFTYDEIKVPKQERWNWKITSLNQDVTDNIESSIDKIIKENQEEHMSFIAEGFEKIRHYFKK